MESAQENDQKLFLIDYTDKSFIVHGEATKEFKDYLKDMGGRFNGKLKERPDDDFTGGAGWIFRMNRKEEVQKFVDGINSGETPNALPGLGGEGGLPTVRVPENQMYQNIKFKVFLPKEGMKVTLKTGNTEREGVVLKTESTNKFVDTVYLKFDEETTLGVIARQSWQIWGYNPKHSLFFENIENE